MILLDTNIVIDMINNHEDVHWNLLRQDAIISYLAIKHNCKVSTRDKHFKLISRAEEKLKLL